jgi:uncharacterized protein involved in tolerance to divalent cations
MNAKRWGCFTLVTECLSANAWRKIIMDKQDIIRMAKEAGATPLAPGFLERFFHMAQAAAVEQERKEFAVHAIDIARKVIEEEREACAKECEHTAVRMGSEWMAHHCAAAIRARGETK